MLQLLSSDLLLSTAIPALRCWALEAWVSSPVFEDTEYDCACGECENVQGIGKSGGNGVFPQHMQMLDHRRLY